MDNEVRQTIAAKRENDILPEKAIKSLSSKEYAATTKSKEKRDCCREAVREAAKKNSS